MPNQSLRDLLQQADPELHSVFVNFTNELTPLLKSIEELFPEFTRHDPSHNFKLEQIAYDILTPQVIESLSACSLFTLLCPLWLHDAGMGNDEQIRVSHKSTIQYREKHAIYERLGLSETDCWRDFVRENHHHFCIDLSKRFLTGKVSPGLVHWVGEIAKSHGERKIHEHEKWPKSLAVADNEHICPPLIAATVRIADILHFNYARAPEYMQEHKQIQNSVSLQHWKAHQIASDYHIKNDICYFDGVTDDDEAYWFSHQFTDAMDDEVRYCKELVLPYLDDLFQKSFSFSRVENRIVPENFLVDKDPITIKIKTEKFLEDLLSNSLYGNRPVWFRELVQNAFDACRDRQAIDNNSQPALIIRLNTEERSIEFEDSGIGMSPTTIRNFLLVAGASYWSSDEYRGRSGSKSGHVGKFGIGFMSVFGVVEDVVIESRHVNSDKAFRFLVRTPRRIVRSEQSERLNPGTSIKLNVRADVLTAYDLVELFDETCTFPEFPVKFIINDEIVRDFESGMFPSTDGSGLDLTVIRSSNLDVTLAKTNLVASGIRGDFHFPIVHLRTLGRRVPLHPRLMSGLGFQFNHRSQIYFGGVTYPFLGSLDYKPGFSHIPSIGCLRLAISPNEFPLEMNLARERFITGENTLRFFDSVCSLLDNYFAHQIETELDGIDDPLIRSSIVAMYSEEMMDLWTGHVADLSYVATVHSLPIQSIAITPWPKLTKLMMKELRFGCFEESGVMRFYSIEELLSQGTTLVAVGLTNHNQVSRILLNSIRQAESSARFLVVLPSRRFGIKVLRHWAEQEILIPVFGHNRCAFGLTLNNYKRPFEFFPRELDHLALPICSGPREYALLDYRDFMAEADMTPSGSPKIIAVLNRDNAKINAVITALAKLQTLEEAYNIDGLNIKEFKKSLILGQDNVYFKDNRERLVSKLSDLVSVLAREALFDADRRPEFQKEDLPAYVDGEEVHPFGRFVLNKAIGELYTQLSPFDSFVTWS